MTAPVNWTCQVGETPRDNLDGEADGPMREAIEAAYRRTTGKPADYVFSGWGSPLPEKYRAVIEDRTPDPLKIAAELADELAILPTGENPNLDALVAAACIYLASD